MRSRQIAVVGATGLVGREILSLLGERRVPGGELLAFATDRSEGDEVDSGDEIVRVERLPRELPPADVVFLCATADVSRDLGPDAAEAGALVIDLTGAFGDDPGVPLLTAGESLSQVGAGDSGQIVSLAHPVSLAAVSVLRPVAALTGLRRVVVTALLSASAFGRSCVEELARASADLLGGGRFGEDEERAGEAMAFNCVPETGRSDRASATRIEQEVRRLIGEGVAVTVHLARVPAFHGQGLALAAETTRPIGFPELQAALREAPSLRLDDERPGTRDVVGSDAVHVAGVRVEEGPPTWVHCWATSDNLRQGAVLHAIRIAETRIVEGPEGN